MRQRVAHGSMIDAATPDEVRQIVSDNYTERVSVMRPTATLQLDATGSGTITVYVVPAGMKFSIRRVFMNLDTASDPSTGNVPLNVAGKFLAYLRSGTLIEYAMPLSPNAVPQIPGVQSWGEQQGPYLRNQERFQVQALGLTANAILTVAIQGLLTGPKGVEE